MAAFTEQEYGVGAHLTSWALTSADPMGNPVKYFLAPDKTVQFRASAWGGATAALQGSNVPEPVLSDDNDWFPLTDPQGNAISKTADGGEQVMEAPLWVRPKLTTAGSGAAVGVHLMSRRV